MASLSCPADDELLCGAGAVLIPLLDEEFALGPPTRQVRPDRVWPFGAGPRIRAPDGEVPGPDGVTGSAEEPDVLRVRGMHAFFTPPSTPFSASSKNPGTANGNRTQNSKAGIPYSMRNRHGSSDREAPARSTHQGGA